MLGWFGEEDTYTVVQRNAELVLSQMISIIPFAFTLLSGLLPVWSQALGNFTAPGGIVGDYSGDLRPQVHFSPPKVSVQGLECIEEWLI